MRPVTIILNLALIAWATCAPAQQTSQDSPSQRELVGTWRAVEIKVAELGSMQGKTIAWPNPFFMRFYDDGTAATWPPYKPNVRTRFEVRDGKLFLPEVRPNGVSLGVTTDQMWYSSDQGDTIFFRRVADLEPGQIP